jgi:hypothetical protein
MRYTILLVTLYCFCALPALGMTYFMSSSGLDSNNGTSTGTPWLTPNHALNCGDTITAAAGTYAASSFNATFGTVTCAAGNNVAWLQCATFDACKINTSSAGQGGMWIDQSYWGIQGWEVTVTGGAYAGCFVAKPASGSPVEIHHIIFANDVANGCAGGGFGSADASTTASVDYLAIVGNIAYNAATGNGECFQGISVYQPIASDTLAGTHIYIAGNFTWDNVEPDPCAGGTPTDGEGIALDTLNGLQGGTPTYTQQIVVDNNISLFNGSTGIATTGAGNNAAKVYFRHNTAYGNMTDPNQTVGWTCGQINIEGGYPPTDTTYAASYVEVSANLASFSGTSATGCAANPPYAFTVINGNGTDFIYNNFGYTPAGNNVLSTYSTGFSAGPNNIFGTNPSFVSTTNPGVPSCGSSSSVPNCMATVIANFTPANTAAKAYGYQIPSTTAIYDPLFPQWLCNVNLPPDLVMMGCLQLHLTVQVS